MQTGAEVIATKVLLFEIELRERMRAVHDGLNAFGAGQVADSLHRSDLSGDVDLMCHQNQTRAVGYSFGKGGGNLIEVLRWNRNLNELKLQAFSLLTLTQRGKHARIILGSGENFIAGLKVHAHQKNLEGLGSIARDRNLFAIAAEQFRQAGTNRFGLRLENLPHGIG